MQRLFTYGTLAPGRTNHHVLSDVDGTWTPATVKGHLYEAGWGAALGCPGMRPAADGDDGTDIEGFVFSSPQLDAHWSRLDAFEGEGYRRVPVRARLDDGGVVDAFVYALARDPTDDPAP